MYLNLCEQCELKKARVKKGLVVKPILSEEMNSRCQLDLIDMQAQEYQGFKYVMAYQVFSSYKGKGSGQSQFCEVVYIFFVICEVV